jgi:hypothetical protein
MVNRSGQGDGPGRGRPTDSRLYRRQLPGGGYVAIDSVTGVAESARVHVQLSVERRTDLTRRAGHEPPVVAEADAADAREVFDELYAIAVDNVEVARALQRWQARRRAENGTENGL